MNSGALNESWNNVCTQVKTYEGIDPSQVNAFFSRLQPQAMSEGFLMLTADNDFIKSWIEQHYVESIKRALMDIYQVPFTVVLAVDSTQASAPAPAPAATLVQTPAASQAPAQQVFSPTETAPEPERYAESTRDGAFYSPATSQTAAENRPTQEVPVKHDVFVQPEREAHDNRRQQNQEGESRPVSTLTFENFVIGDSNRMAYSMAVNVAEMPGKTPLNPLFIYGKSGLGKTHLMRAIQNYICETQPYLKTVYVDSAELLSDYMEASAAHDKEKSSYRNFKMHYEEADVLLIDDIQYLQGKKQTLDIVFQIFNKLTSQGKQIVLSADRAPKNIDIDERYHSRFNQGGTIDIQPPEIETKLGIVKSFINEYQQTEGVGHLDISQDIQMYIAENSSSNIRELKSAVTKVIYQITFFNQTNLTVGDVRTLLENHFSGGTSKNLTVEDIQKEVEAFFKVKHSDLVGPKRARNVVYPRQIAIYLCRQLLDLPFNDIGKKFNRDHSTAMHSVTTVEEMLRSSREVQEEVETLKQIIREL